MEYFIKVAPDVNIFVHDLNPQGRKAILFLHGWPLSHKMFEYQYNRLVADGYRCIGMDGRGFGNSDKPLWGYDYNRLSDDVRSVVDAFRLQDSTLVGHSTGGAVAVRYMARHNGYGVSRLVLLAAAAPSLIKRPYFPYGQDKETIDGFIRETYNDRPALLKEFGDMLFHGNVNQPIADWLFQIGLQSTGWSMAAVERSWLLEEQLFYDLEKVNVPTLILHGIHDRVCPFPLGEAQKQGIRNARLVPFENSGHGLFWQEHDKVTREMEAFIG